MQSITQAKNTIEMSPSQGIIQQEMSHSERITQKEMEEIQKQYSENVCSIKKRIGAIEETIEFDLNNIDDLFVKYNKVIELLEKRMEENENGDEDDSYDGYDIETFDKEGICSY